MPEPSTPDLRSGPAPASERWPLFRISAYALIAVWPIAVVALSVVRVHWATALAIVVVPLVPLVLLAMIDRAERYPAVARHREEGGGW